MSNFAIDINVHAPELTSALDRLAAALSAQTAPSVPQTQPVPTQSAPVQPAPQPVSAPVQSAPAAQPVIKIYNMDELAKAAGDFMTPANVPQLQALLASFGVNALPELPESQFGAFAAALREMGAKI